MPIVRVLSEQGVELHNCAEAGCDVSWDGYALADGLETPKGERVEGATDVGPEWRRIDDTTVRYAPAG